MRRTLRVPAGMVQLSVVDMGRLPDELQRSGVGAHMLRLAAVCGTVVAEFHPMGSGLGATVPLANILNLWVRPQPGTAPIAAGLPAVLDFGGGASVRIYSLAAALRGLAAAGRISPIRLSGGLAAPVCHQHADDT